jgi:hypothetical protein
MSRPPARNRQLSLLLLIILAATACSKSPPKQATREDSLKALVEAMKQGDSGKAARPAVVVPKDLVPVALAAAQDYCRQYGPGGAVAAGASIICKDYKLLPPPSPTSPSYFEDSVSKHLQVTDADRANGIEDKWCVGFSYVARSGAGPWKDNSFQGIFTKQSAAWKKLSGENLSFGCPRE